MADKPQIQTVTPSSALPGQPLTLAGTAFGTQTPESAVYFRVSVSDAAVPAVIDTWTEGTITVRVPPLSSFGSGGPLELIVQTDAEESAPFVGFILKEEAPPEIAKADPTRRLEHEPITLTGSRFGRQSTGSKISFHAPGPSGAVVDVAATRWEPTSIEVEVPALDSLGGAGQRSLSVVTPWGSSEPANFLLGELPSIEGWLPETPSPGTTFTVTGRGFGPRESGQLLLSLPGSGVTQESLSPAIVSWSNTAIEVTLPGLPELRTTGFRNLFVKTDWGECTLKILIEDLAAITCWTRLEPHARTTDLQQGLALGLQAQVYDALWLLGRQWQLLELRGQDAGSPVAVHVAGTCTPLARWRPGGGDPEHVPAGVPLEAIVERERDIPPVPGGGLFDDLRLSAEAGLQLLRMLDAQLNNPKRSAIYRKWFVTEYRLELPAEAASFDARSRRFLALAERRVPDGSKIHAQFQGVFDANPQLPKKPPIIGHEDVAVYAAIRAWYAWCGELFSEAASNQRAWDPSRMEYGFSAGSGQVVLEAREHDGGHLDWYSFVRRVQGTPPPTLGAPAPERQPVTLDCTAIPTPVSYPGMPVLRWWQLEDQRVDFGAVAAGPNELLKLVLLELATVYGNDWFTMPIDKLPVGALCELGSVTVTDAFGFSRVLAPFGDLAGSDWRMFELTRDDGVTNAGNALLLLDALPATLESSPVEEVLLLRDELANMAWAVEKVIESRTGRPFDRHEDEVTRRAQPAPPTAGAPRRYLLQTTVPRNWIPLIPKAELDNTTKLVTLRRLARGAMRDPTAGGQPIPPLGRLLDPGRPLYIFDEELRPNGVRVTRLWTLGRASNGRTHLWRARRTWPGRGGASSGLHFDLSQPGRTDQK